MRTRPAGRHAQAGLSAIELMVGLTVGMVVLAGTSSIFATSVDGNRRMLAATRLNQEMRAAADVVARDLRRAGYWQNAVAGIAANGVAGADNAYAVKTLPTAGTDEPVYFRYATDADNLAATTETYGFRLSRGVLQMSKDAGGTWEDLTDPSSTNVTTFSVTPVTHAVSLAEYCVTSGASMPQLAITEFRLRLAAASRSDTSVRREIRDAIRVRSDEITGSCPP